MALGMEAAIDLPVPPQRGWGRFTTGARPLPSGTIPAGRRAFGVKFIPWGDDVTVTTVGVDCDPEAWSALPAAFPAVQTQQAFDMVKAYQCSTLSLGFDLVPVAERALVKASTLRDAVLTRELVTGTASGGLSLKGSAEVISNTATAPAAAVEAVEEWVDGQQAGGEAILWVSSKVLVRLAAADLAFRDGDTWRTATGHVVVGDPGFGASVTPSAGGATAAGAGDTWVYVSGSVWFDVSDPEVIGSGHETIDFTHNDREVLATAQGILVFDPAVVGAIKVDL